MNAQKITDVLSILISVCVHTLLAETFPYISFRGQTLENHSYVNLSLVGNDGGRSDSVQCITDLATCCINTVGSHRGDWYFPDGTRLPFSGGGDIYEKRQNRGVDVLRSSNPSVSGIYCCAIPTIAVHDESDTSIREMVYVGIHLNGGKQRITYSFFRKKKYYQVI